MLPQGSCVVWPAVSHSGRRENPSWDEMADEREASTPRAGDWGLTAAEKLWGEYSDQ